MVRLIILVFGFFVMVSGLSGHAIDATCPKEPVVNGVADLRCWDGRSQIALKGLWFFDYQALNEDKNFHGLAPVPLRWREMEPPLPFLGRGVYRIKLLLPEPMDHLGLKIPATYTARKIVLIDAEGSQRILFDTGKTELNERAVVKMRTPIIHMTNVGVESELIAYINGTETMNAGFEVAPIIGVADDMIRRDQVLMNSTTVIFAILIVFFAINIYLWWVRDRDLSLLSLALVTFAVALRQVAASGVLYEFMPSLSIRIDSLIGWGTFFGGSIVGMIFFRSTYPNFVPKWLAMMVYGVASVGFGILLSQPHNVMQHYGAYINFLALTTIIIMVTFLINGLRNSDEELRLTILSCTGLLLGFAADVIYYRITGYNPTVPLIAIGMLVFVGTQSIIISRRYTHSLRRSAELSNALQISNANLEEKVKERTVELAFKNKQLEEMARTDALTELANRRAFDEVILHEVGRSQRSGKGFVISIIDLDDFKPINDTYGHEVGDQVLQGVAKTLRDGLRAGDFPFRWGGDEFCILFPETTGDVALVIAERLKQAIEAKTFLRDEKPLSTTASFGLAVWREGVDVDEVIKQADQAMYESKKLGSNKVTAWWHMSKDLQQ